MKEEATATLKVWRCWKCHNILAKMDLKPGSVIESKCKCNSYNFLQIGEQAETVGIAYRESTVIH